MDIRAIKLYLDLCDTLHFSRTATRMHVSPSTLSRTLQRLEDEVGCKLLERDNRSVTLTHAGEAFRRFASQTLTQWQELRRELDPQQKLLRGTLQLYCSVTAAYSHLPALLDKFRRQQPLVDIKLTTGDAADAVQEIQQQRADIAIAALPRDFPPSLHFAPIGEVPLSIIAPTINCQLQSLLAQNPIPWEQLPFIVPDHGPGRLRAERWFKAMGIKANIYAQVSGHEAIVPMVALGCGVSITPDVVVANSPLGERIKTLASPAEIAPFELGCCCKTKRRQDPLVSAFLEVI
ncbi:HTH-type transcriptional activator IlvY [Shewanella algae]|uniref:HTH-type transcriptional activator IlvY n=1 Tax=Shewanella algae TaxID=38313 RepID=UPI0011826CEF|nr:HTH-type transcriptional activator IlvY [Shewanella algae]TVO81884.1 transcriptional regulator IlvY [Shewanella algae]TVO82605.1 transcriptional regulator IlvY [Shewanella algae]TVO94223.1 transcriptional regulator IlvY [Shewanella algae]